MTTLILFIICTAANVIFSTIRSIMTIKGTKLNAATWNAISFGLYSYIVVLTATAPITTTEKVLVTALCNFFCVYGVKMVEEKMRKDKLWKIELSVPTENFGKVKTTLNELNISFNYIPNIGDYTLFNIYAASQAQTKLVCELAKEVNAKSFASETKLAP